MKRLILVMALCLLFVASTQADVRVWLYGGDDLQMAEVQDVSLRIGYIHEDVEIGLSSTWWKLTEEPQVYGLYALYHLPAEVNIPTLIPVDWLPAEVKARPYFGAQVSLDFVDDGRTIGPVAGLIIQNIIFTELQYLTYDGDVGNVADEDSEFRWVFGLCHKF